MKADRQYSPWTGLYPFELVRREPLSAAEINRAIIAFAGSGTPPEEGEATFTPEHKRGPTLDPVNNH